MKKRSPATIILILQFSNQSNHTGLKAPSQVGRCSTLGMLGPVCTRVLTVHKGHSSPVVLFLFPSLSTRVSFSPEIKRHSTRCDPSLAQSSAQIFWPMALHRLTSLRPALPFACVDPLPNAVVTDLCLPGKVHRAGWLTKRGDVVKNCQ